MECAAARATLSQVNNAVHTSRRAHLFGRTFTEFPKKISKQKKNEFFFVGITPQATTRMKRRRSRIYCGIRFT